MSSYVRSTQVVEISDSSDYSDPFVKTKPSWQDTWTSATNLSGTVTAPDTPGDTVDLSTITDPVLSVRNNGSYTVRLTYRTNAGGAVDHPMDLKAGEDVKLVDVDEATAVTFVCQTASQSCRVDWIAWSEA